MLSELEIPGTRASMTSPVLDKLQDLLDELHGLDAGDVATYIPELGQRRSRTGSASRRHASTATCTRSATRDSSFTIQSISKPFVLRHGARGPGAKHVLSQSASSPPATRSTRSRSTRPNRPFNPMVNAGAIVTTGLIARSMTPTRAGARLLELLRRFAGRDRSTSTRRSTGRRAQTGDRNRAIAYLMQQLRHARRRCRSRRRPLLPAVLAARDCRDLAMMAATLANGGVNPMTGRARPRARSTSRTCSA